MAEAGWYDDPLIPGGKRYWDGVQWTDHAQAPPVGVPGGAGFAGQQGGPPPFASAQAAGGPPAFSYSYSDGKINDLGEWISRSFKMVIQQIGPLSIFAILQLLFFAISYLLLHQSLQGTFIDENGIFGFNLGLGIAAGAAFFLTTIVGLVAALASHHNLYGAGTAPDWSQSLSVGFGRLLRYIGINLMLMIAFYVVIGVLVGILIGLTVIVGDSVGIIVAVGVVAYIAMFVFLMWASIKLALLAVAVSVVPRGTSALRAAWDATTGFFWPILGRLLLLGMLLGILFMVPYVVSIFIVPTLFFSQFDILADGDIAIDGQPIDSLDVFEFADFLPNPILVIVFFGIVMFLMNIIRTVSYSGSAALYADLGGPNSFGHTRR